MPLTSTSPARSSLPGFSLQFEELAKGHSEVLASGNVPFQLHSEIQAVVGQDNAGKSTLIKTLAGVVGRQGAVSRSDPEHLPRRVHRTEETFRRPDRVTALGNG